MLEIGKIQNHIRAYQPLHGGEIRKLSNGERIGDWEGSNWAKIDLWAS
jgi:hypothetical protein